MDTDSIWKSVQNWFEAVSKRCCCASYEFTHQRFENQTQENPATAVSPPLQDDQLNSLEYDFALQALDTPELNWRPKLRLQDDFNTDQNSLANGDLGHGSGNMMTNHNFRNDSNNSANSTESGIGRSVETSSSTPELAVSVTNAGNSKTAYRIKMQSVSRSWSVHRTPAEFYQMQKFINIRIGKISTKLPPPDKICALDLENYAQKVFAHENALKMSEIRLFFKLDSGPSSSSVDTLGSLSPALEPKQEFLLDPSFFLPAGVHVPPTQKGNSGVPMVYESKQDQDNSMNGMALGCVEKKITPKDFTFLSVIGKGSFGRVMLAKYKEDGRHYAVKVLSKKMIVRRNETAHVMSERSVLIRVLKHPYVVQLHYAFTTPTKIFFVLDFINGGELFFHLQKERTFSEKRSKFYAAEICCAICYMHTMGIVYRDLKPENILLDREGHIVLTDFGLCKEGLETGTSRTATFCGTPEYLAPEVILKKAYTRSVDWWTLGAVLYEMLYGLPPFYSRDTPTMYEAIINKPLKLRSTVSSKARSILSALLQKDSTKRLGAGPANGEEVKSHAFFQDIDWKMVEQRKMKPPFVPKVSSDEDTSNIDPTFTREPVSSAPDVCSDGQSSFQESDNAVFQGFSYVPSSILEDDFIQR